MIKKFGITAYLLISFLTLPGFTQNPEERAAQNTLPQSHDTTWDNLAETDVKFDSGAGLYSASIPPAIKALEGKSLKISGFMLPLEAEEKFTHFLLSKRTPTCAFCPPGEPDEIIDVHTSSPIEWDDALVTYEGVFKIIDDREFGLFFQLNKAEPK